jgi:hypothetical protein
MLVAMIEVLSRLWAPDRSNFVTISERHLLGRIDRFDHMQPRRRRRKKCPIYLHFRTPKPRSY